MTSPQNSANNPRVIYRIRPALASDWDGIAALLSYICALHAAIRPDLYPETGAKYTRDEYLGLLGDPGAHIFVAAETFPSGDETGNILGHAFCLLEDRNAAGAARPERALYLDDLCVDPGLQRCGIGGDLLDACRSCAAELGCSVLTLHVLNGNDPAVSFYQKEGFRVRTLTMEQPV